MKFFHCSKWSVYRLLHLIGIPNVNLANSLALSDIAYKFNNCNEVKYYNEHDSEVIATASANSMTITFSSDNYNVDTIYNLNGNILTTNFPNDFNGLTSTIMTSILVDALGVFHGYSEGELLETLNSDGIENYTVENEGFEIEKLEDGNIKIQIDISKKNTFNNDEVIIFIGEKDELTTNTYNSIISVLDVMFNSDKVTNYFKENYSGLSIGNKNFKGFNIEINPEKSDMEETVLGSDNTYKFVRITISKKM